MKEKISMDKYKLDCRVVERYLKKGEIKKEEYENYLKELPDLSEEAAFCETSLDESEMGLEMEDSVSPEEDYTNKYLRDPGEIDQGDPKEIDQAPKE